MISIIFEYLLFVIRQFSLYCVSFDLHILIFFIGNEIKRCMNRNKFFFKIIPKYVNIDQPPFFQPT